MENSSLISENSIIESVITLMEQVEEIVNLKGLDKKIFVLKELKLLIGDESYDKYNFMISSFIDFTIKISKGNIKLNLNNIKKKYCCF